LHKVQNSISSSLPILSGAFRQEVISSIVTHAGSGSASEGTAALNLFKFLTIQDPSNVAPFLPFVKGILDFVDCLSNLHIRILFQALSFIACARQTHTQPSTMNCTYASEK